jgi:predicted protein tyrosine phosphatase
MCCYDNPVLPMTEAPALRRILFVCYQNRRRSATAERLFCKRDGLDVRSAGIGPDALVRVNARMIEWADAIFVMEEAHSRALERMFPAHAALKRVVSLDIPDEYDFLDPELVDLLNSRVTRHLQLA